MRDDRFYHGGIAGLAPGDQLVPSPPHVEDGCPICIARSEGRVYTIGDMKRDFRGRTSPEMEKMFRGSPDWTPIDPPSGQEAIYLTTDYGYARWYAARSKGDLYRVRPVGEIEESTEDLFPTWTAEAAIVTKVLERGVRYTRSERAEMMRRWGNAERGVR
jgi:hypothetical protein